ncbi:IS6 family transposase [Sulfitobacter geojensis]|uniref:IS6 family transposase n=1 Tax=Sulfitobacter geojensis TaxID=1342299 RepID=A0AAE3B6V4_9RHOB|nr:IS6 family transposase [Sulfitobacter geojensis]MBM1689569.1 IS6 family transposase [Sulfitobacter geojensis]MBM1693635.1 IS6 family transposase [Sulfitobacter geojensis]MBM1705801.1 IS6 family transposase [Sulfitobacter geojensis]MBM1709859.1 IS6 family transposase [Sulfitobacter geojensis]MBM1713925.1 IS6 family transposase [Sulfitobacter geojensis]
MQTQKSSYKHHRFPPQNIAHVVWLYVRFNLSLREVEELMLERGVDVSHETIRRCIVKFGPLIAHALRRRQPRLGDIWHLDEVVVKIAGRSYWLWRAVDQHVVVLEEILHSGRDKRAAKRLLVKLMKRWDFVPKRIITDKLRSYGAAKREVAPGFHHWPHKGLNNRAENSHLPFRKRERVMQGFRSPGSFQRFVSTRSATRYSFSVPACRRSALSIRYHRLEAFEAWKSAAHAA